MQTNVNKECCEKCFIPTGPFKGGCSDPDCICHNSPKSQEDRENIFDHTTPIKRVTGAITNEELEEERGCLITESRLCANIDCKKHWRDIPPKSEAQGESWEVEFSQMERQLRLFPNVGNFIADYIKSFIAKKLEEAREEGRQQIINKYASRFSAGRRAAYQEVREVIAGMKRTDDAQMNDDHVYDEALSDLDAAVEAKQKEI